MQWEEDGAEQDTGILWEGQQDEYEGGNTDLSLETGQQSFHYRRIANLSNPALVQTCLCNSSQKGGN